MDLIFEDGQKLYIKQNPALLMETMMNTELCNYQKVVLNTMMGNNSIQKDKVYGDDFLIEIGQRKNINGYLVIGIKDFDENQKEEAQISICFNEKELGQFISLLQQHYETWE